MTAARVTAKGQITVPKRIRERLGVRPGDRIAFRERPDGSIVVEAESVDLLDLRGAVKARRRGVSLEQMEQAIQDGGSGS